VKHEVLYQKSVPWLPGETTPQREARLTMGRDVASAECYPGSYPGRVISLCPVGSDRPSLRNMADKDRLCVVLDLSDEERQGLASRQRKISLTTESTEHTEKGVIPIGSSSVPSVSSVVKTAVVSFEDRWGAVAPTLRRQFEKPEEVEAKADDEFDFEGRRFAELASLARDILPPAETHTGTGLYAVKASPTHNDDTQSGAASGQVVTLVTGGLGTSDAFKGGYVTNATRSETRAIVSHDNTTVTLEGDLSSWADTDDLDIYDAWSTVQAAHDQLYTDQGSSAFTATQTLRIYDGTYTENVTIQSALNPQPGYRAIIEANSGDTVVVQNSSVDHTFSHSDLDTYWTYSGFKIENDQSNKNCLRSYRGNNTYLYDMTLENTGAGNVLLELGINSGAQILRCTFTNGWVRVGVAIVEQCTFTDGSINVYGGDVLTLKACTFYGRYSTSAQVFAYGAVVHVLNCTFVGSAGTETAIDNYHTTGCRFIVRDCIFDNLGLAFESYESDVGEMIDSDYNCFNSCTKIATWHGSDYTTLANWQAATVDTDIDSTGSPDANSISSDPLLTDPAGGDFSLGANSPCRHAGMGSGVATGSNSVAFDPNEPDIGAWSSGAKAAPSVPTVPTVIATASDKTVTVTVTGDAGATYRARLMKGAAEVDEQERIGPGDIALSAADYGMHTVVAWGVGDGGRSEPSGPVRIFACSGSGPFGELRSRIVSRLAAHPGLVSVLGTDEWGAVPIYASAPATGRLVPCIVYTLTGVPEARLDRPGRWVATLTLESWGGTPGVNDRLVSAADEVLQLGPFEGTAWAVKRIARTDDVTRWEDDGRTEVRRTTWSITVDRAGT